MGSVAPATLISFPATSEKLFSRNVGRLASMPDLEDAVPEREKDLARRTLADLLATRAPDLDAPLSRFVVPRVNAPGTTHFEEDLTTLMHAAPDRFHGVVVPKLQTAAEVEQVLRVVRGEADRLGWRSMPWVVALIETVRGVEHVAAICDVLASHGSGAVLCGHLDLASDARLVVTDAVERHRELREWTKLVARTAKSRGLGAIDGPFPRLAPAAAADDELAFTTGWSFVDGYDGRLVIHPSQVQTVHDLMVPGPDTARESARILRLAREHGGAFRDEQTGEMIDNAVRRSHWALVERACANHVIDAAEVDGLEPPAL